MEITYAVSLEKDEAVLVNKLKAIPGVEKAVLVSYNPKKVVGVICHELNSEHYAYAIEKMKKYKRREVNTAWEPNCLL